MTTEPPRSRGLHAVRETCLELGVRIGADRCSTVVTATQTATLRSRTGIPKWGRAESFRLHTEINRDTAVIAASQRSAKMMTEDAKFALGF
jgi:hypothetical protein